MGLNVWSGNSIEADSKQCEASLEKELKEEEITLQQLLKSLFKRRSV